METAATQRYFCVRGPFDGRWIPIKGESTIEVLCSLQFGRGCYKAAITPNGPKAFWTGDPPTRKS